MSVSQLKRQSLRNKLTLNIVSLSQEYPSLRTFIEIFSLSSNASKLMSPQTTEKLTCIDGLRVICITWIVLGHVASWTHYQVFSKLYLFCLLIIFFLELRRGVLNKQKAINFRE